MSTGETILIIENDTSWRNIFEKILRAIGENKEIIMTDFYEFDEKYKSSRDFDNVGFCFVDLELGAGVGQQLSDTWGKDKVLPIIRRLAPWIPVACISRYISGEITIVGDLSTSDFDGIYPKEIIATKEGRSGADFKTHPDFNSKKWDDILKGLQAKRVSALTGRSVEQIRELLLGKESIDFKFSNKIEDIVESLDAERFKEGIALLALGGKEIAINEIVSGFSGVYVCKVGAYGEDHKGPVRSYWLLKWGKQIRKLEAEAEAHFWMFQRGIERKLQIPQLHHHVVYWRGIGYIAYGFEEDASTALELINNKGLPELSAHIETIASSLYSKTKISPIAPRVELEKWCKFDSETLKYVNPDLLQNTMEITRALIHGDLHLRNILIKDNLPTLIDFARSDLGPVAIDLAKLVIDILVFHSHDEIKADTFTWAGLTLSTLSGILSLSGKYLQAKDDKRFFELSLRAYASAYLKYIDVDDNVKKLLRKALES